MPVLLVHYVDHVETVPRATLPDYIEAVAAHSELLVRSLQSGVTDAEAHPVRVELEDDCGRPLLVAQLQEPRVHPPSKGMVR